MAPARTTTAGTHEDQAQVPAAGIRALRDAIAELGRFMGHGQRANANTVLLSLGAQAADVQALYEYLDTELPPAAGDPQ